MGGSRKIGGGREAGRGTRLESLSSHHPLHGGSPKTSSSRGGRSIFQGEDQKITVAIGGGTSGLVRGEGEIRVVLYGKKNFTGREEGQRFCEIKKELGKLESFLGGRR